MSPNKVVHTNRYTRQRDDRKEVQSERTNRLETLEIPWVRNRTRRPLAGNHRDNKGDGRKLIPNFDRCDVINMEGRTAEALLA